MAELPLEKGDRVLRTLVLSSCGGPRAGRRGQGMSSVPSGPLRVGFLASSGAGCYLLWVWGVAPSFYGVSQSENVLKALSFCHTGRLCVPQESFGGAVFHHWPWGMVAAETPV